MVTGWRFPGPTWNLIMVGHDATTSTRSLSELHEKLFVLVWDFSISNLHDKLNSVDSTVVFVEHEIP